MSASLIALARYEGFEGYIRLSVCRDCLSIISLPENMVRVCVNVSESSLPQLALAH